MKLSLLPAGKGDCILVTGADGRRLLVDGGVPDSYRRYVAKELAKLDKMDVVCVSHIDQDHIGGILQLMDDMVAWKVHHYQRANENPKHPVPQVPSPPKVGKIWHNAFHEQVGQNAGAIQSVLAATATVLSGAEQANLRVLAQDHHELAQSVGEALRLSRRVGAGQLGVPLNPEFGGKLMLVGDDPVKIRLGGMKLTVIGPFKEDLKKLRSEWDDWLRHNKETLRDIQREARSDEGQLKASDPNRLLGPLIAQAQVLGNRTKVTTPNLASLMLLAEEQAVRVLLTGDGHGGDVIRGLEHAGKLSGGTMHVDVLKVQHHGSENNLDQAFCKAITADHYVFSANGAHQNPDVRVVAAIIDSRLGSGAKRSPNAEASNRFTMWFNSSSRVTEKTEDKRYMRKVEDLLLRRASPKMKVVMRRKPAGAFNIL
jgi:beta-lactamase superfamily II metal-dependent hydrolase